MRRKQERKAQSPNLYCISEEEAVTLLQFGIFQLQILYNKYNHFFEITHVLLFET